MDALARYWWVLAIRGVLAILFGILFLVWPLASLASLVLLFGVWALVDGVAALISAIEGRRRGHAIVEAIFGIGIAALTFLRPGATALALYTVIAAWAVVLGVFKLVAAVRFRHVLPNDFWLGLSGVTSVLFGVLMIALPVAGIFALSGLIGFSALLIGLFTIASSLRLRRAATAPLRA